VPWRSARGPANAGAQAGRKVGGDGPALGDRSPGDVHDVQGTVEDDRVRRQGVEPDQLLLPVGVEVGRHAVAAEAEPAGGPVAGLDMP